MKAASLYHPPREQEGQCRVALCGQAGNSNRLSDAVGDASVHVEANLGRVQVGRCQRFQLVGFRVAEEVGVIVDPWVVRREHLDFRLWRSSCGVAALVGCIRNAKQACE